MWWQHSPHCWHSNTIFLPRSRVPDYSVIPYNYSDYHTIPEPPDPLKGDFLIRILSLNILGSGCRLGIVRVSEISNFRQNTYEDFFKKCLTCISKLNHSKRFNIPKSPWIFVWFFFKSFNVVYIFHARYQTPFLRSSKIRCQNATCLQKGGFSFCTHWFVVGVCLKRMNWHTESYQNICDLPTEREYERWLISNCNETGKILIKGIILVEKNGSSLNDYLFSKIQPNGYGFMYLLFFPEIPFLLLTE